jgi:restriction system protein
MRKSNSDAGVMSLTFSGLLLYGMWPYRALIIKAIITVFAGLFLVFVIKKAVVFSRKYLRDSKRAYNLDTIDVMSGVRFERCVAQLLNRQGFTNIRLTEQYDFGVDIVAVKDGVKWGVQVKRYNGMVKAAAVRQVVTALRKYNCSRAMVVSNSYYSRVASELAKSNNCKLVDRAQLSAWLIN